MPTQTAYPPIIWAWVLESDSEVTLKSQMPISATHLPVPQLMDNPDQSFRPSHQILGVSRSHHIQSRWNLVAKGSLLATRMLFSCWIAIDSNSLRSG